MLADDLPVPDVALMLALMLGARYAGRKTSRRPDNRLGYALVLLYLRYPGRALEVAETPPDARTPVGLIHLVNRSSGTAMYSDLGPVSYSIFRRRAAHEPGEP
jgi:hypothetical protein